MCGKKKIIYQYIFTYMSIVAGKETHRKLLNTRFEKVTPKQTRVP